MISYDTYNRIQLLYQQLLVSSRSNATANCSISIRKILGDLNKNCLIDIINTCVRDTDTVVLLDIAVAKILDILNSTDKTSIISLYNNLRQECIAQSSISQSISIQDIDLGKCNPSFPTRFIFTNSGNATSNCIVNKLIRETLNREDDSVEPDNTSSGIWVGVAVLSLALVSVTLILLKYERKIFVISTK